MSEKHLLHVKARDLKIKSKKYRADGFILGNISGHGSSQALALPLKETRNLLNQIGESSVFYLLIDDNKKEIPVLLQEVQTDPLKNQIIHIAMKRVSLKEKVTAAVAFSVIGELTINDAFTILAHQDVEVEALPTDLPEEFVLDVSKLTEIGQQITYADLDYDRAKVTLLIDDESEPILIVSEAKGEVEEVNAESETEATENETAPVAGENKTADKDAVKEDKAT